jgi:NAD(P)-dependent dehydrogenase (short-subunit alcohol dehydrogenase family)
MDMHRSVVVTGASTGIGRATVAELVGAGFKVWPTVRREEDAQSLIDEHREAVEPLLFDVTDEAAVRAAGEKVRAAGPLHGLVNNAGAALPGPLEYQPLEAFRKQLEINLVGQLAVTQAMLPALRAARDGGQGCIHPTPAAYGRTGPPHSSRIVIIGSIGGRIAGPISGAYHAAKYAVVGLAGSLRAELAPSGIRVVLIEPGAIKTPIWDRGIAAGDETFAGLPPEGVARYEKQIDAVRTMARRSGANGLPPEHVGRAIRRALTSPRPRARQVVGRDAQIAAFLVRVLPHSLVYRMTAARD